MRLVFAALLLIAGTAQAASCAIFGVSDGDSLKARCDGYANALSVRLRGVDAPEVEHKALRIALQPGGIESRDHLRAICLGKPATVTTMRRDRYGRTLARVVCDGTDASEEQVRSGNAWAYLVPKRSPLLALEAQARAERRGLWASPDPVKPSLWRRQGP